MLLLGATSTMYGSIMHAQARRQWRASWAAAQGPPENGAPKSHKFIIKLINISRERRMLLAQPSAGLRSSRLPGKPRHLDSSSTRMGRSASSANCAQTKVHPYLPELIMICWLPTFRSVDNQESLAAPSSCTREMCAWRWILAF
jgi:hypothetical protein